MVGMLWLILVPLWLKMTARLRHPLVGILKRTPVGQLDLQPGDIVEVKSLEEIAQTLDTRGCNRGLRYDRPLSTHSGKRYRVRGRLDRMISEPTGEMRKVEGTVILENATCQCYTAVIGGCPRQDFTYWREIWLKRV